MSKRLKYDMNYNKDKTIPWWINNKIIIDNNDK